MDKYMVCEEAYKNGYAKGYEDGKNDCVQVIHCINCENSDLIACPKEKVWCHRMSRYMKENGFCSEGKHKD